MARFVVTTLDLVNTAFGGLWLADWSILLLQVCLLAAILFRSLTSRPRNLVGLLVAVCMLLLVQGQAAWMLYRVLQTGSMHQLNHIVTQDGVRVANVYALLCVLAIGVGMWLADKFTRKTAAVTGRTPLPAIAPAIYLFIAIWTVGALYVLVQSLGGLTEAVLSPGRIVPGQTALLLALGLAKMPLLYNMSRGQIRSPIAWTTYLIAFVAILFNSRFLAFCEVLQAFLVVHYAFRPLGLKSLGLAFGIGLLILFAFGLYRDFSALMPAGTPLDAVTAQTYLDVRVSGGIQDWFYSLNDEGFAGLAGILTFQSYSPNFFHDYGLSTLRFVMLLIPNSIRIDPHLPFAGISSSLESAYPYHGSIVAPGLEMAYAHFGVVGILALGLGLGYMAIALHRLMVRRAVDVLLVSILCVQILQLIRGTFEVAIVFGLADLLVLFLFRAMVRTFASSHAPHGSGKTLTVPGTL